MHVCARDLSSAQLPAPRRLRLHRACLPREAGNDFAVLWLLNAGANPTAMTVDRKTPKEPVRWVGIE